MSQEYSQSRTMAVLDIILWPATIAHELTHWCVARAAGLDVTIGLNPPAVYWDGELDDVSLLCIVAVLIAPALVGLLTAFIGLWTGIWWRLLDSDALLWGYVTMLWVQYAGTVKEDITTTVTTLHSRPLDI